MGCLEDHQSSSEPLMKLLLLLLLLLLFCYQHVSDAGELLNCLLTYFIYEKSEAYIDGELNFNYLDDEKNG